MPSDPDTQDLTDLVYASLVGERSWQDFLDRLRRILPNGKAFLVFHDAAAGIGAFPLNAGLDPGFLTTYDAHYSSLNPWMHGASVRPVGRAVRAEAMLPRERLAKTEFFGDWLHPQELESGIGVTIFREQQCNFMISVLAADADEAVYSDAIKSLQALVPHLRRAFNWYRRDEASALGLPGGASLRDSLRLGTITVGTGRKVRTVSGTAARLLECIPELSIDSAGRFRCAVSAVLDHIDSVLLNWMRERCGTHPATFLLPRNGHPLPVRITVIAPPREQDASFFRGPECIVLLEDPVRDLEFAVEELGALYKLTAAEQRVVAGLAAGHTLNEAAALYGISPLTARTQLKQVFTKTGMRRQSDLIRNVCFLAGTLLDGSAFVAAKPTTGGTR
jgi:DNA-binding CsgD family transcriptional regulator